MKTRALAFVSLVASTLLFSIPASASSATSKAVEDTRTLKIDKIAQTEEVLAKLVSNYIKETVDLTPTRAEIQQHFNSLSTEYFRNYRNETCAESAGLCTDNMTGGISIQVDLTNKKIILGNILGDPTTLSSQELEYFTSGTTYRSPFAEDSIDNRFSSFSFVSFSGLQETFDAITVANGNSNVILSLIEPTDQTKIWQKPNGDGTFTLYIYDSTTNSWRKVGETRLGENSDLSAGAELKFYKDDGFDPDITIGQKGWTAKVETDNGFATYTHNGTKWVVDTMTTGGLGQIFEIADSIDVLLDRDPTDKWFSASSGSEVDVNSILGNPSVKFKRYLKFWRSDISYTVPVYNSSSTSSKFLYIASSLDSLPETESEGAIAWLTDNNANAGYMGDANNYEAVYHNGQWISYVPKLSDLITSANSNYAPYWVKERYRLYNFMGLSSTSSSYPYWKEEDAAYDGKYVVITKGDRTDLPIATDANRINLTGIFGDDPAYTTSGINTTYLYNGNYIKKWVYMTTGTNTNYMADAIEYDNLSLVYSSGSEAAIVTTGSADVPNGAVLIKGINLNGSIAYKYGTSYVSKTGYKIPFNKLPDSITCSNASIVNYNSTNYIAVSSLNQFVPRTDLDVNYPVRLTGDGFSNKYIKKCSNSGQTSYSSGQSTWSDNCSNMSSATLAVTDGSREDLVSPSSSTRINLSKDVGGEPNYTTTGVTYANNTNYKQWFYSVSGTITNQMLDGRIASEYYSDVNAGSDLVNATNGKRFSDNKIWGLHEVFDNKSILSIETTQRCIDGVWSILLYDVSYGNAENFHNGIVMLSDDAWYSYHVSARFDNITDLWQDVEVVNFSCFKEEIGWY